VQIGAGRLVDPLNDARFALGDLSALSVDGRNDLLVERVDQQRGQAFRARSARVAGLTLLETAGHQRLAAANIIIALGLGRAAPAICSTPRGAGDTCRPLAKAKFRTTYRVHKKLSID
jgi:hypothetical protein